MKEKFESNPNPEKEEEKGEKLRKEEAQRPPEDLIRKLSRVVLHAAERKRKNLFEKLTAANADKIAELMKEKPIFYANRESSPQQLLLDPELGEAFPEEFYNNPTAWIESQKDIERGYKYSMLPSGENIEELWEEPYDVSKVKEFAVARPGKENINVVSKRIEPRQLEEVALAKRAYESGIPTPRVLGEVINRGNVYALFESIPTINLNAANERLRKILPITDIHTVFKEQAFESYLKREEYRGVSETTKQELRLLWKNHKDAIRFQKFKVYFQLLRNFYKTSEELKAVYLTQLEERLSEFIRVQHFSRFDRDRIARQMGLRSFDEFSEIIRSHSLDKIQESSLILNSAAEVIEKRMHVYAERWRSIIRKGVFGFDPYAEKERLKKLCEEQGIEHKDFADRNLLIPWDFKKGLPAAYEEGKPRMYIVDWEPKKKNNGNPKG